MIHALKERIGDPALFCGRQKTMALLMNWVEMIPKEMAKSRALLGRRKCGKTAMMQRLFNILWNQNGQVIPFYFEVYEVNQWIIEFSDIYYRTFVSQYFSFKTRTVLTHDNQPWCFSELIDIATEMDDNRIIKDMSVFQEYLKAEQVGQAINFAFGAPARFTGFENFFCLVMIDEVQFMSKHIFYDKTCQNVIPNLPGAYHGLVELKVAPMLVSGSYVGWMTQMMHEMFKGGRLKQTPISPKLAAEEGMEAVYRYGEYNNKPVSEEAAFVINLLTQSDPFYIATLFRSDWEAQDFTTVEGAIKTLAYEVQNTDGELFGTWSEYIYSTLKEVNDKYAKQILLFLSKKRHKECTRLEISEYLGGKLSDSQLEDKLRTLYYGNLITKKSLSHFRYSGIPDDILDLIFRYLYQEEIDLGLPNLGLPEITSELSAKVAALEKEKKSLQGALNELKGRMLEFIVYRELNKCQKTQKPISNFRQRFRPLLNAKQPVNMEKTLAACGVSLFNMTWMNYFLQVPHTSPVELDVLAIGEEANDCWALVFEMKNRNEAHLPLLTEAQSFVTNVSKVKQWLLQAGKKIRFICPVYFSALGFEEPVEVWLHKQGVFTTDMAHWEQ